MQADDEKQVSALNRAMAAVLRGAIASEGLSQKEVAQRTGFSLATIQRNLAGARKFNLDQIDRIGEAIGIPGHELMRRAVEWRSTRMSEAAPDNVVPLRKWTAEAIDADTNGKRAANHRDEESDADETD